MESAESYILLTKQRQYLQSSIPSQFLAFINMIQGTKCGNNIKTADIVIYQYAVAVDNHHSSFIVYKPKSKFQTIAIQGLPNTDADPVDEADQFTLSLR